MFRVGMQRMASNSGAPGGNYFILLMLTDGIITDMTQTCEAIVNVSVIPYTASWYYYCSCFINAKDILGQIVLH